MTTAVISPVNVDERSKLDLRVGDTVKVHLKIKEASGKTRIQIFEGTVLAKKHGKEAGGTFTVRRTAGGFGVEKIFPLYSPSIDKIEIVRRSKVRQSKLYYIREKAAREIKRQMRRMTLMYAATEGETERADRETKEADELAASAALQEKEAQALQEQKDAKEASEAVEKSEEKAGDVSSQNVDKEASSDSAEKTTETEDTSKES